jgi:hypothetical protein
MPHLRIATLDDVDRKRGDLDPITATLRDNGVVANLAGATITVTITDSVTRIPIVFDGACTIVSAPNGTVSFQPTAPQMDVEGLFDVEFKQVIAGVPSHFPSASYSSLRIWSVLGYPPLVPPVNPGDHTVPLSMLAQQTPGSVLIYDASGNAAVRVPVAAGRVLTDNGPGLPPTYQAADIPFLIDHATVALNATYTSPVWTAGKYARLKFVAKCSVGAVDANVTLAGLVGTYKGSIRYDISGTGVVNAAIASWRGSLYTGGVFKGEIEAGAGYVRKFDATYIIPSVDVEGQTMAWHDDTTHAVTGFVMTPSAAGCSFEIWLWGYLP